MLGELLIYGMHYIHVEYYPGVQNWSKKYSFCFFVCSAYLSKLITTRVKELTKTEMPCEVGKGTNCTFWKQAKLSYLSYSPGGRRRGSRVRRRRARILK